MNQPLEELYFNWLTAKVVKDKQAAPSESYWTLLKTLQNTEFVWLVSGDDNRAEDGKDLRRDFILEADIPDYPDWRTVLGCSVLEMLIGFSKRAEWQTDQCARDWFWEFISNLGLKDATDASLITSQDIEEFLEPFIWRNYEMDGRGGLFPMRHPHRDQRDVEIWYQFCDYLVDQDRLP